MADTPLTSLDDALEQLLAQVRALDGTESVDLNGALGRVLAEDYRVPADVPPADNSSVDGYALRAADLGAGKPLAISNRIPAGSAPTALKPGTAARLFTGSEIPSGADAVVMQEDTELRDGDLVVKRPVEEGQNIRRQGQDLTRGNLALPAGTRIRPQEIGLLASLGIATVTVKPENMKSCDPPPCDGADTTPPAPGAAGSLIPFPEVPFVQKTKADEEIVMLGWEGKQCGVTASCENEKLHSATGFAVATVQLTIFLSWKPFLPCAKVGLVYSTSHTGNNKNGCMCE